MYLYKITNRINGKAYIGVTKREPNERWRQHKSTYMRLIYRNSKHALCHALKKYGVDNFDFQVLATADSMEELKELEKNAIQMFNTFASTGYGYNLSLGGDGSPGHIVNDEARAIMSRSAQEYANNNPNPMQGRKHSDETKELIRQKALGRKISKATRKKISKALKGRPSANKGRKRGKAWNSGLKYSDEQREALRKARAHYPHPSNKPVMYKGVRYESGVACGRANGLSKMQVKYRKMKGEITFCD